MEKKGSKKKVSQVYLNGVVYTCNEKGDIAQAFAVHDGKIVAVGSNDFINAEYEAESAEDLKGQSVYPGFIDAHCHLLWYGKELQFASLTRAKSYDEVIKTLKEFYGTNKPKVLMGKGWNNEMWDDKVYPDKRRLDAEFPAIPVVLIRRDYHAYLVNSKMMEVAKIDKKIEVEGGDIETFPNGELSGMFVDKAMRLIQPHIPALTRDDSKQLLERAGKMFTEMGLTAVMDAGLDKEEIEMFEEMYKEGRLKLRVNAMTKNTKECIETYLAKGGYKSDRMKVDSMKLFGDGALGSRGAKMLEPYSDMPDYTGIITLPKEELEQVCELALKYGFQICTHALGDCTNRYVLQTYSKYLKGPNDLRWRIEHSEIVHPDDVHMFKDFSVIPSMQPSHAPSDCEWALIRIGPDRLKYSFMLKELVKQNGYYVFGSDCPVENFDPIEGFYTAVFRQNYDGNPKEPFQMENALSREEGLKGLTIWSAKGMRWEKEMGSIEAGKYADFVVLSKDILTAPASDFPSRVLHVRRTFIQGECVYSAGAQHQLLILHFCT